MMKTHSWMVRGLAVAAVMTLAAACGNKDGGTTPKAAGGLRITEQGLGGITATTPVLIPHLSKMFPDLEVKQDPENEDILELFKGSERYFYVVAAKTPHPEEGVFN